MKICVQMVGMREGREEEVCVTGSEISMIATKNQKSALTEHGESCKE